MRSSNATVLKKAVDNGVLFAIYDATYDDLEYFADVTDTYCAAVKSDEDIKNELFLIYDTPDGNLYFILSPYAMDDVVALANAWHGTLSCAAPLQAGTQLLRA